MEEWFKEGRHFHLPDPLPVVDVLAIDKNIRTNEDCTFVYCDAMKTKKMEVRAANEEEAWVKRLRETTAEDDLELFKKEVARVNPDIPIPAENDEQLFALDGVAIFAPEYAKWQQHEGQIPHSACSVRYCPDDTMAKHAAVYGLRWQVEHHDDPEKRFWHLQKNEESD